MKVKTLALVAGACAFAMTSVASADKVIEWSSNVDGIGLDIEFNDSADFLADNGLKSALISITGVELGAQTVGILGTGPNPFVVQTDGGPFHNYSGIGHTDASVLSNNDLGDDFNLPGLSWNSGFFNNNGGWGLHAVIGQQAFSFNGGGQNEDGSVGVLISDNPQGSSLVDTRLMRVTWDAGSDANGSFVFALVEDAVEVVFHWSISQPEPPVPAPGALALLGLAGLVGARRRRA